MKKPAPKPKPTITAHAILRIKSSRKAVRALSEELAILGAALTVDGNGTVAEYLAHNALLGILTDLAKVRNAISDLHEATTK
jgi:hypothetical protein